MFGIDIWCGADCTVFVFTTPNPKLTMLNNNGIIPFTSLKGIPLMAPPVFDRNLQYYSGKNLTMAPHNNQVKS
jgi:hypothetical protein